MSHKVTITSGERIVSVIELGSDTEKTLRDLAGITDARIEALSGSNGSASKGEKAKVENLRKLSKGFLEASGHETSGFIPQNEH